MNRLTISLTILLVMPMCPLPAQTFSSGEKQVPLIELYTSEGCSSCPPAEAWLSRLRTHDDLWKKFVPIAFHVTYWDNLGWKDGSADDAFTQRQRDYAASWKTGSVYTPCFVRDGVEWHPPGDGLAPSEADRIGNLTVTVANGQAKILFHPAKSGPSGYEIHLSTIGGKIETAVRAGENAGRTLRHDFVALSLQHSTLNPEAPGNYTAVLTLPRSNQKSPPDTGLIAWVTAPHDLRPLQTTGGFLQP